MSLELMLLEKAINMLKAAKVNFVVHRPNTPEALATSEGLKYAIELPDSSIIGNISIAKSKKPRKSWAKTGYIEAIKSLGPGDTWSFTETSRSEAVALQKAVSSVCHRIYGSGNYMSSATGCLVEVARLQ